MSGPVATAQSADGVGLDRSFGVLVLTYNRAGQLAECLGALVEQIAPTDILVLDNASVDDTAAMMADRFADVGYVVNDSNLGCPGGRNVGIELLDRDWVACIDDDAVPDDDFVSVARAAIADAGPTDFVFAGLVIENGEPTTHDRLGFRGGCCVLHRRTFLDVGGYPLVGSYGEERNLMYRVRNRTERDVRPLHGMRIVHDGDDGVDHRAATHRQATATGLISLYVFCPAIALVPMGLRRLANLGLAARRRGVGRAYLDGVRDAARTIRRDRPRREPVRMSVFFHNSSTMRRLFDR